MTKREYTILQSWWEESERTSDYVTRISYQHVWKPGDTVEEFCAGMTANLGSDGWELVTITTSQVTLLTADSPQGNNGYGNFPVHRLYFKRPVN